LAALTMMWLGQDQPQRGQWDIILPQFSRAQGLALLFVPLTTVIDGDD
jgi:hypothetical protein